MSCWWSGGFSPPGASPGRRHGRPRLRRRPTGGQGGSAVSPDAQRGGAAGPPTLMSAAAASSSNAPWTCLASSWPVRPASTSARRRADLPIACCSGAARVYAVDVGYGQLDWKLRQDPRVVAVERTNFRHVQRGRSFPRRPDRDGRLVYLPRENPPRRPRGPQGDGDVVALVKPQFEAGRKAAGKGAEWCATRSAPGGLGERARRSRTVKGGGPSP